jgi:hypothetical protein
VTDDDDRELAAASGAYALHALDGREESDFEELLARSPGLRNEVTELSDTAVELGLAVPAEDPPAALRAALLAAVAATPQLPPAEAAAEVGHVDDADPAADPEPALAPVTPLAWYRRPVGALTAAAAAVLLAVGAAMGGGAIQSSVAASQVAAIAAAPDAAHATARLAGGGTARLVWSDELGRSGIHLADAPALGLGRTYQLWYIHGSTARSAGTTNAAGDVVLDGALRAGDVIGVTVEPAGGSAQPTTTPVVTVATT